MGSEFAFKTPSNLDLLFHVASSCQELPVIHYVWKPPVPTYPRTNLQVSNQLVRIDLLEKLRNPPAFRMIGL